MELLKRLIAQHELTVTDAQISTACKELDVDEDKITVEQAAIVVEYLIKSIAPANSGKLAKASKSSGKMTTAGSRKTKTNRTPTTTSSGAAIANAFNQTATEVEQFKAGVIGARDRFAENEAQQLMDAVAETPNVVVQRFAQLAGEYQSDPTFFRSAGEAFGAALFRTSDPNEAEQVA